MAFLTNEKLMVIEGGGQTLHFFNNLSLKQSLILKIPLGMIFDSRNSKMTS